MENEKTLDDVRKDPAEYNNRLEKIKAECFAYHKPKSTGDYIEDVQFLLAYIDGLINGDSLMQTYVEKTQGREISND